MGKENAASFHRSITYQVARKLPGSRDCLRDMVEDGVNFTKATVDALWTKVVLDLLFQFPLKNPLHWIIGGLDK